MKTVKDKYVLVSMDGAGFYLRASICGLLSKGSCAYASAQ
jgi:hypothetical protein